MQKIAQIVLISSVLFAGCEPNDDTMTPQPGYVFIEEALDGLVKTNFYTQTTGKTKEKFTIILDTTHTEAIRVFYSVNGTAEIGKHIDAINSTGSVTIPVGSRKAVVEYNILTYNLALSESVSLTFRLSDVEGGQVRINPALASYTNQIQIKCISTILPGRYIESSSEAEVQIVNLNNNKFSISNLNFRYYNGPEYGEIPGEFEDICGDIRLLGKEIEDKYRVAWIGNGTWDESTETLLLSVSDKTFNPNFVVKMEFRFSP